MQEELSRLLDRLDQRAAEGLGRLTYYGHALNKTEDSLILAVPAGIIAIPLQEVECISPMEGQDPEWVWVGVRSADRVQQLVSAAALPEMPRTIRYGEQGTPQEGRQVRGLNFRAPVGTETWTCGDQYCSDTGSTTGCPPGDSAVDDAFCFQVCMQD